ncbi:MAG: hypothetical protein NC097_06410 [Clostridium sp.]|nr:hypothetical protein [Prevotella sp.]MCM1429412.1 hypothetical protein [Clostridium sp.]MCM1475553.1 hypothetical protein [Muribaculaceae bacterium]
MKKYIILILITLFSVSAFAQKKPHKRPNPREVLEFKMKFLAQEMDLSADQQQKFFPLYTQMDAEIRRVFHSVREIERRVEKDKNSSEADYAALNSARTEAKGRLAEIEKEYDAKFAKFLSKKQIVKMKEAEATFRQKMKEAHKRRHQ